MLTLAGVIGVGKTSLAKRLAKIYHSHAYLEPVSKNPVLPLFYKGNQLVADGKRKTNPYTFLLQIYFLNIRFRMMKKAVAHKNDIMDRSIYEDRIFMKMNYNLGNTTKEEWNVYQSLLLNMMQELPYAPHSKAPDLMIYLKISLHNQLIHIKKRGRSYEQLSNNPHLLNYYSNLQKYYKQWYKNYNASPKIMINMDNYDFVNNKNDFKTIVDKINYKLAQIRK